MSGQAFGNSLTARLWLTGLIFAVLAGFFGWLWLERSIRQSTAGMVDARLLERLDELHGIWATFEITGEEPFDSGDWELFWQISIDDRPPLRSAWLIDNGLTLSPSQPEINSLLFADRDLAGQQVRLLTTARREMVPAPPGSAERLFREVRYWAGMTAGRQELMASQLASPLRRSTNLVVAGFVIILMAALAAIAWIVQRPVARLRKEAEAFAGGEISRLSKAYPQEIQIVVNHLNAAASRQEQTASQTRRYINKIAHDLTTPIAVVENAMADPSQHQLAKKRLSAMREALNRYSTLATALGPGTPQKLRPIYPHLEAAVEAFALLFRAKPLQIELDADPSLQAAIALEDLDAIVSNVLSNAHKFANQQARLSAGISPKGELQLACADDGPGLDPEAFAHALGWGVRLDERPAGSGLGLAILADFADLYGGRVERFETPLGGLGIALHLPVKTA